MRDLHAEASDLYTKNRSDRSGAIRRELMRLAECRLRSDATPEAVAHDALTLASIWIRGLRTKLARIEREVSR